MRFASLPGWFLLLVCCIPASGAEIRILSYNVYFNEDVQRYERLIAWSLAQQADIILFQECTPSFEQALRAANDPTYSRNESIPDDGYGQITLSRLAIRGSRVIRLPTRMARKALVSRIELGADREWDVVNVHLESLENGDLRQRQIGVIAAAEAGSRWIIAGDFNGDGSAPENAALHALVECAPTDPLAVTYDPSTNALASGSADPGDMPSRIDRAFISEAEVTGSTTVVKEAFSDHYPIVITLRVP